MMSWRGGGQESREQRHAHAHTRLSLSNYAVSRHFFRSILEKSELDKGLLSVGGAGAALVVPLAAPLPGRVCRCRDRGSSDSWVRPRPLLDGRRGTPTPTVKFLLVVFIILVYVYQLELIDRREGGELTLRRAAEAAGQQTSCRLLICRWPSCEAGC